MVANEISLRDKPLPDGDSFFFLNVEIKPKQNFYLDLKIAK